MTVSLKIIQRTRGQVLKRGMKKLSEISQMAVNSFWLKRREESERRLEQSDKQPPANYKQ